MKFVFTEVRPNNEKNVAVFRSEDQSCDLFIAGNNPSYFSQFKVGQSYTIAVTEEEVEQHVTTSI